MSAAKLQTLEVYSHKLTDKARKFYTCCSWLNTAFHNFRICLIFFYLIGGIASFVGELKILGVCLALSTGVAAFIDWVFSSAFDRILEDFPPVKYLTQYQKIDLKYSKSRKMIKALKDEVESFVSEVLIARNLHPEAAKTLTHVEGIKYLSKLESLENKRKKILDKFQSLPKIDEIRDSEHGMEDVHMVRDQLNKLMN